MSEAPQPGGSSCDTRRLIAAHQASVWRYLRALGCEPAEADDLTQETFLRFLQQPFQEVHPTATAAYLRKTAYHLLVSARRRDSRTTQTNNLDDLEDIWSQWSPDGDTETLIQALRDCLEQLTPRARRALEMRFRDNLSRSEIAADLTLSEDGAKNLMQRAKQQLRACVDAKTS